MVFVFCYCWRDVGRCRCFICNQIFRKLGTGVSRIVETCKTVGLPEPEYGTDGAFVWITFKRPNSVTNSDSPTQYTEEGGQKSGQKSSQKSGQKSSQKNEQTTLEHIYVLIKNNPCITRKELVKATGKASSYIQRCINQLKETKRIRRVGPDKGGFWEIINPNEP